MPSRQDVAPEDDVPVGPDDHREQILWPPRWTGAMLAELYRVRKRCYGMNAMTTPYTGFPGSSLYGESTRRMAWPTTLPRTFALSPLSSTRSTVVVMISLMYVGIVSGGLLSPPFDVHA